MFVIIYALLGFVQESQILQLCYNVEQFSDILFHVLICNNVNSFFLTQKSYLTFLQTSWDRPKSAPFPRLKNSKKTSKFQIFSFTVLENRKFFEKKFFEKITLKNGPSGAPDSASASPWPAKRGTLSKLSTFLSQVVEGRTLWREKKIEKKSHNAAKLKGGPFGVFQHPFCRKTSINWRGNFYFRKKTHSAEKKLKGGTLWDFQTSILSQNSQTNWRGTLWGKKFPGKSLAVPKKNWKGTLWSRPVWYVTREIRKNLFGSVR